MPHKEFAQVVLLYLTLLFLFFFLAAPVHAQAASLTITWTDTSTKEDGFKLQRALTNSTTSMAEIAKPPAATGSGTTVTYVDSGLAEGQQYCYRVAAYNVAGDSAYTAIACATTAGIGIPSAPINLKAVPVPATSGQLSPALQPEASPQQMSAAAPARAPGWTKKQIEEQTYDPQYFTDIRTKHWKHSDPR